MSLAMKTNNIVTGQVHFDPSSVTDKQLFIVCQIVSCSVILPLSVLLESINKLFVQCQ